MIFNRLLLVIWILITGTLASFYGGNISYALFYMALAIPIVAFSYTVYVYVRFKLYQTIGKRTVVKGEVTEYIFQLANEDILPYENIKVNFYYDKSRILGSDVEKEYSLLPGEKQNLETFICCNYRGEYYVGAKTVTITDFLYLFSVTYPVFSKMKVIVLPRIVVLQRLRMLSANSDSKGRIKRLKEEEEEADLEVRKYMSGDNKKRINWKVSAKKGELLTRKYTSIPKIGVTVFADLSSLKEDELTNIVVEDKIIESMIAIADYCRRKNIISSIYFERGGIQKNVIKSQLEFDYLYRQCVEIRFNAEKKVDELINNVVMTGEVCGSNGLNQYIIIITHFITEELYKTVIKLIGSKNECGILFIAEHISEEIEHLLRLIMDTGANITVVKHNDDISDFL